ncbi:MAG: hypothetical protein NZM37_06970 [Sandaracinaceae bacterium]|nr:hypothetical protein [Sandaracinaceae bacterium]MDW8247372.1 hypothetical protein [Sandaracinaceae bacterium]
MNSKTIALNFNSIAGAWIVACVIAASACGPRIGDSCSSSTQCSFAGDRICDTNQPGGSCTVFDCQPDQCPDNAVCVRFRSRTPRLQILACMKRCNANSDCREGEGYRCVGPEDFADRNSAEIVDRERPNARFCAALGVP